jgi:hypothetical protein
MIAFSFEQHFGYLWLFMLFVYLYLFIVYLMTLGFS